MLSYHSYFSACGTIPVGYPKKDVQLRYRRPVAHLVHWNGYAAASSDPQGMLENDLDRLRPSLMYRNTEMVEEWDDAQEKCGEWYSAFAGYEPNPSGQLE